MEIKIRLLRSNKLSRRLDEMNVAAYSGVDLRVSTSHTNVGCKTKGRRPYAITSVFHLARVEHIGEKASVISHGTDKPKVELRKGQVQGREGGIWLILGESGCCHIRILAVLVFRRLIGDR